MPQLFERLAATRFRAMGAIVGVALLTALPALAQEAAVDRLGVPGPIAFDGTDYALAWSAQPSPTYFKQEYLPAGQDQKTYETMLIVEVITEGLDVRQALASQVQMLNARKPNDPLVNFSVLQNEKSGEAILDFIMSAKDDKGEYIVEWNAYRYTPRKPSGVTLFAVSHRGYGNDGARQFLMGLKELRPAQIDKVARQPMPDAQPK